MYREHTALAKIVDDYSWLMGVQGWTRPWNNNELIKTNSYSHVLTFWILKLLLLIQYFSPSDIVISSLINDDH